jgi:hypothetical protein
MSKKKKKILKTTTTVTEEIVSVGEKTLVANAYDRSGSISSIIDDVIGGSNQFIKDQKKLDDEAYMTIALFDDQYELLYDEVPIKEVELLDKTKWYPRGTTALYDAIGKLINQIKASKNEYDKVIVCIVTDGYENSSIEYNSESIKKLIKECEEELNWTFVYLAANQDAFDVGTSFGISAGNTYSFSFDSAGAQAFTSSINNAVNYYRSTSTANLSTSDLMDSFGEKKE